MKYEVFISYAHADAESEESNALIASIKNAIETALQGITDTPFVFLDSEALKWGEEWEEKIRRTIGDCSVFVFLLSPNYLRSDYCHRERLWWEYHEIMNGRLNKGTRPVYYVLLKESDDPNVNQYMRESLLVQTDGTAPFFESLDQIRCDLVRDRIRSIADGICEQVRNERATKQSFCSVYPRISKFFVGRLEELMTLNAKTVEQGKIPVVRGEAGVGKTELAVAYAYAYAENFPQGRFMIPMQGITDWQDAMAKLVEWCGVCCMTEPEDLGLPKDFGKLPPEKKKESVFRMLANRAKDGPLLILLDNLEDLNLITDSGLSELTGPAGLPANLRMIATTRLGEKDCSTLGVRTPVDVGKLKEKDALELFCKMGDNVFPFAKYPLADGKLMLDFVPENKRPSGEKKAAIEQEYAALKDIIVELDSHAWSLEIVAGRLAANIQSFGTSNIPAERDQIRNDPLGNLTGKTHRNAGKDPESLLRPTFDLILRQDGLVEGEELGRKMMRLAETASFFPPEQIPEYALRGIWEQCFGAGEISWEQNGVRRTGKSVDYALTQLKEYRIVNGDGPLLKMHRLTREVLQNRLSKAEKLETVRSMLTFLDTILSDDAEEPVTSSMLLPWSGWAGEWGNKLEELQNDEEFLETLGNAARRFEEIDFYDDAKNLHQMRIGFARKLGNKKIIAESLFYIARMEEGLMHMDNAIRLYAEAIETQEALIEENRGAKEWGAYVIFLKRLLFLLRIIFEDVATAKRKYPELFDLVRRLDRKYVLDYELKLKEKQPISPKESSLKRAKENEKRIEALKEKKVKTTSDHDSLLFGLIFCGDEYLHADCYDEAAKYFHAALELGQELAKKDPEKYEEKLADIWASLAKVDENRGDFLGAAEKHLSALNYIRNCRNRNQGKYDSDYCDALDKLGNAEKTLAESLNWPESRKHYENALKWHLEEYGLRKKRLEENQDDIAREDLIQSMDFTLFYLAVIEGKIADNLDWPESREHYEKALNWYAEEYALLKKRLEENQDESARGELIHELDFTIGFLADIEDTIGDFLLAEFNAGQSASTPEETPEFVGHYNNVLDWCVEKINLYQQAAEENPEEFTDSYRNAVDQYSRTIDGFAKSNLLDEQFHADLQTIIEDLYQDVVSLYEEKYDLLQKRLEKEDLDESARKELIQDLASTTKSLADLEEKIAVFLLDAYDDSEQSPSAEDEWQECADHLDNVVNWHQRIIELYRQTVKENPEEYIAQYRTAADRYSDMNDRLAEWMDEDLRAEQQEEINGLYQDVLAQYLELERKNPGKYAFDIGAITLRLTDFYANAAEKNDDDDDAKIVEELLSTALDKLYAVNTDQPENASRQKRLLPFLLRLHAGILAKLDPCLENVDIEIKETEQALELLNDLLKENPDNETLLENKASCLHNLSVFHRSCGRFDEAQEEELESLMIRRELERLESEDSTESP